MRRRRNILLVGRSAAISLVYSLAVRIIFLFLLHPTYLRVELPFISESGGPFASPREGEKLRVYFWAYERKRKRERNTHNERRDRNGAYLKTCSLF